MKKLFTTMGIAVCFVAAFGQNVVPDNGFVGLGTTTPNEQLQVKGNVRIDSVLLVDGDIKTYNGLIVAEESLLHDVGILGKLVVDSVTTLHDTLVTEAPIISGGGIESNGSFIGNGKNDFNDVATFNGNIVMSSLNDLSDPINSSLLFLNNSDHVEKLTIGNFFTGFSQALYGLNCLADTNGSVLHPTWFAEPDMMYSLCARIGIGAEPRASTKLDVDGRAYVKYLAIGADPETMTGSFHLRAGNLDSTSAAPVFLVENPYRKLLQVNNQGLLTTERIFIKNSTVSNSDSSYVFHIENGTRDLFEIQGDGLMRARKIIVDQKSWADFVFEEKYPLMPTEELRTFISTHHRLPNVPSAETVEEEGVDLAEMNRILLQKIEELTLYMLEQQKEIDALKEKVK